MSFNKLSFRSKVLIVGLSPLVLLLIIGVISMTSIKSIVETNKLVIHTYEVLEDAMEIIGSAVNMETGMRGYLLSGKEDFLDPYISGEKATYKTISLLKETVNDNPTQVKRLDEVEKSLKEWQKKVTEPIIELRRKIGDAKTMNYLAKLVGEGRGKKYFDKLRNQIETFIQRESTLMAERHNNLINTDSAIEKNLQTISDVTKWVDHTYEVINAAQSMLMCVINMETGVRGFLLAGEDAFLEPYNNNKDIFIETFNQLQTLVNDNLNQVKKANEMNQLIKNWIDNVVEPSILLRKQVNASAKSLADIDAYVSKQAGKRYIDAFRKKNEEFCNIEQTLMMQRKNKSEQAFKDNIDNFKMLKSNRVWVDHTHNVISQIKTIMSIAVDMETGMRGYLLAGKEDFLDPYKKGSQEFFVQLNQLKKKVEDNPSQVALLGEIENSIQGWMNDVTEPTIALRRDIGDSKTMDDMADIVGEGRGKKYFDKFRQIMNDFSNAEKELMIIRQESNENTVTRADITIIVGIIVSILIGLGLCMIITRGVLKQLGCDPSKLAAAATKIAQGDMNERLCDSDNDSVAKCLDQVADVLENVIEQFNALEKAANEGNMDFRGQADQFKGDYKKVVSIVNQTLDNISAPWMITAEYVDRISKGDMPEIIKETYQGDFGKMILNLNNLIVAMKDITQTAEKIASGDLTVTIKERSKVDVLMQSLSQMASHLNSDLLNIRDNANTLSSASEELSTISGHLVKGSENMTNQSETVASATEQMSANINAMASAAEEMSVNSQGVSSTAEQMSQNMNTIASAIEEMTASMNTVSGYAQNAAGVSEKAKEMSGSATETMNVLGKAAEEIGQVTEVIKRIAEQTNILALNATIEAASAGEAGKGFAVVANEIKELANQSASAAEDIASKIKGVQNNTQNAVAVIVDISKIINNIHTAVKDITTTVEEQKHASNEISANVQQANTGVKNIAQSISEVAIGSNEMSKNAGEAAQGSNDVSSSILHVKNAAQDANNSARDVNTAALDLAKIAERLNALVGKFQLTTHK